MSENQTQTLFDELAHQFALEIRQGNSPKIQKYADLHPALGQKILDLFPVLEIMERNGMPLNEISESSLVDAQKKQLAKTKVERLGDYRIVREIGRGGMGIVFEAQQESLDRRVALKLLPDSAQFDSRRQQRFHSEAKASAMLHHTNIVPVFGVGEHEGISYFVMQFIEGQPLDSVLRELSKSRSRLSRENEDLTAPVAGAEVTTIAESFSQVDFVSDAPSRENLAPSAPISTEHSPSENGVYWKNIARMGIQVAQAIQHAHSKKLLHRDIKPSNLLIEPDGSAWVTDFGLAKYFESPDLTKTGEVIGTLRYMSPEQLNGKADERSDIFALGLTLYEMAALQPAYDAADRSQLLQQVVEANPKPLRSIDRGIPKDLETIIHKCISNTPESRYQEAQAVAEDLERFVAGEPVLARRISPLERFTKWCRRRPAISALLAALILSLIGGVAGIGWQWQKASDALELAKTNLKSAKQQKEIAQEHFRQARESVNHFLVKVSNSKLLKEQRLMSLRKELLQEALKYHQEFVYQYNENDELKLELAQSLYSISSIEQEFTRNSDELEKLEIPIKILVDLVEADPSSEAAVICLANCYAGQAAILSSLDLEESISKTLESINLLEEFRKHAPDSPACLQNLASTRQQIGLVYERIGQANRDSSAARKQYEQALLIRMELRELLESKGEKNKGLKIENEITIAKLHRDLGVTARMAGNFDDAAEHYNQAIDMLDSMLGGDEDPVPAIEALAAVSITVGFFYGTQSKYRDFEKSLEYFELSKTQYQKLVNLNPLIISHQRGLARAAVNIGGVHQYNEDLDLALEQRELAEKIRRRLTISNPDAPYLKGEWAAALNAVGSTLRELGRFEESLQKHSLAHETHCQIVEIDPRQTHPRLLLINGLVQSSLTHAENKDYQNALKKLLEIKKYTLEKQTEPVYRMAVELMVLGCKIDQQSESDDDRQQWSSVRGRVIEASQEAFVEAANRGCDVLDWVADDVDFLDYREESACIEIAEWVKERFESK